MAGPDRNDRRMWWVGGLLALFAILGFVPWIVGDFFSWTAFGQWLATEPLTASEVIRNYAFLTGILGGAVALGIAFWRAQVADRDNALATQSSLEERFQQAALGLTNDSEGVRVASAISLKALVSADNPGMNDRIASLCEAMIDELRRESETENLPTCGSTENAILETAIIARARCTPGRQGAKLSQLDLNHAVFEDLDFGPADLSGSNLTWAILRRCILTEADFTACTLVSMRAFDTQFLFARSVLAPELSQAYLWDCTICVRDAPLNLMDTLLQGSIFVHCRNAKVDLSSARIRSSSIAPEAENGITFLAWADRRPDIHDSSDIQQKLLLIAPDIREGHMSVLDLRDTSLTTLTWEEAEAAYPKS